MINCRYLRFVFCTRFCFLNSHEKTVIQRLVKQSPLIESQQVYVQNLPRLYDSTEEDHLFINSRCSASLNNCAFTPLICLKGYLYLKRRRYIPVYLCLLQCLIINNNPIAGIFYCLSTEPIIKTHATRLLCIKNDNDSIYI